MKISVVIVCLNEAQGIRGCLQSILSNRYPLVQYEVIVVDGDSIDGTIEIVSELQEQHPNLSLIIERRKGTALARKVGIDSAHYDYVAFTDADCEVPENWLELLSEGFKRHLSGSEVRPLAAVGGGNRPVDCADRFVTALGGVQQSWLGNMGSTQGAVYPEDRVVDSIPTLNILYDKSAVLDVGNFDPALCSEGEDADMNFRLTQAGYRMVYLSDASVGHHYRADLAEWGRNMLRYGRARAGLLCKHGGEMWRLVYLLPLLFLFSFLLLPASLFSLWFALPLLYFPAIALYAFSISSVHQQKGLWLTTVGIYLATHFGYAAGMVQGFLRGSLCVRDG